MTCDRTHQNLDMLPDLDSFGGRDRDEEDWGSRNLLSIEESSRPGGARSVRSDENRVGDLARFESVLGEERLEERAVLVLLGVGLERGREGGEGDVRGGGLDVGRSVRRGGVGGKERDDVMVVVGRLSSNGKDVGWKGGVGRKGRGKKRGGLVGVSQRFAWRKKRRERGRGRGRIESASSFDGQPRPVSLLPSPTLPLVGFWKRWMYALTSHAIL